MKSIPKEKEYNVLVVIEVDRVSIYNISILMKSTRFI